MLSKDTLQDLNIRMVCEGEPIDRDFSGYNKVHFYQMLALSHLPELTDLQAYAIVSTLSFYKNTQLRENKSEIEDTLKHYHSLLSDNERDKFDSNKSYFKYADIEYRREHGIKDPIHIISFNNHEVTVHYNGFVNGVRDWVYEQGRDNVHWQKAGDFIWNLVISWDKVPAFLEFMSNKGTFGYESAELTDMCQHLEDFIQPEAVTEVIVNLAHLTENDIMTAFINCYKKDILDLKDGDLILINFSVNDSKIRNLVFAHKDIFEKIAYKWRDQLYCMIKPSNINKLSELLEGLNIKGYEFSISEELLKYNELLAIQREKATKGEYSLIDLEKRELPFTPYKFQIDDANRILQNKRYLLSHDMGCGKTFISAIVGESIPKPKLVICPESLRLNWRREILNVNKDAHVINLYSNKPFVISNDWTICGYATAVKFKEELLKADIPVLFIDEAHLCKAIDNYGNPSSKRADTVLTLTDKAEYVYPLTGTPIPTSNKDIFNILRMLKNPLTKDTFYKFGIHFCAGFNNGFGYDFTGNSNGEELRDILSKCSIRRLKTDVLPDLTKQRVFVPIEAHSAKCDKIEKEMKDCDESNFLGYAQTIRRLLSGIKIKSAMDLADTLLAGGDSVVIVTEFKETIDKIEQTYKDNCCTIEGGMSDKAKQQAIDDFQNHKKTVCALNLQAGGVGITLTAANHMIICDYDWTPANMIQVEDRICRAGQTKPCMIHYIYAEDMYIDRLFVDMISSKSANADYIVDGNASGNLNLLSALRKQYHNKSDIDKDIDDFER